MSVEIATLMIEIDATKAVTLKSTLDDATAAAGRLDKAAGQLKGSADRLSTGHRDAAKSADQHAVALSRIEQSTKGLMTAQQIETTLLLRNDALRVAATKTADAYARKIDNLAKSMDPLAAVQITLAQRTKLLDDAMKAGAISAGRHADLTTKVTAAATAGAGVITRYGAASRQTGQLLGQMSFQLNDVVTGLISGQKPFQILAQQGGQIFQALQMGPGGVGGSLKALGALLSPVNLAIGATGLALGGVVVAAGAVIIASRSYAAELRKLDDISRGVGATSGLTADSILAAAQKGADAQNISIAAAEKQARAYALTGQIGGEIMAGLIGISKEFANETGIKTADAVKKLGAAFADPAKGAGDLNNSLHFLNDTQQHHIEQLAKEGDLLGAQRELYAQLDKSLDGTSKHVAGLAALWDTVQKSASGAFHAMTVAAAGPGAQPLAIQIANGRQNAAIQRANGYGSQADATDAYVKGLEAQVAKNLQGAQLKQSNSAITDGGAIRDQYDLSGAQARNALIAQQKVVTEALTQARINDKGAVAGLAATQDALNRAVASYLPPAEKAHQISELQARIAATTNQAEKGRLTTQLEQVRLAGEVVTSADATTRSTDAGRVVTDKANRSAQTRAETLAREASAVEANIKGLIDLAAAYAVSEAAAFRAEAVRKATTDATRKGADVDAAVSRQIRLAVAEQDVAATKAVAALNDQTEAQRYANDQVAAGALTYAEANEKLRDDAALRPFITAAANAEGAQKERLTGVIRDLITAQRLSNEEMHRAKVLASNADQDNQIEVMEAELALIGKTNRERAVTIAQLQATQALKAAGVDPTSPEGAANIAGAGKAAGISVDVQTAQDAYNDSLRYQLDLLTLIDAQARAAGQGMADAFGRVGTALGNSLTVLTSYAAKQEEIAVARKAYTDQGGADAKRLALFDKEASDAQIESFGDMAHAAKGFFSERSAGYKALEAVEKGYRAIQFALAAKAMFLDATETGSTVAMNAIKATSHGVVAIAKAIASMPFPLNLAAGAATAAALVAIGVNVAGGGKTGSISGATDAKDRQDAQGAGSVLGDATAKSDSLTKSLEMAAKYQNKDLEFSNNQLKALRSIESNIGAVAGVLARQLGVSGGAFDTAGLGLGTTKKGPGLGTMLLTGGISALLPGLFGSKSTTTLQDMGLQFGGQSLADILSGGISGQSYQQTSTTKTSKLFGIKVGSKTSQNTATSTLDEDLAQQLTLLVASLKDGVLTAAGALGITGAEATLDAFTVNLGKLSFKDLTGEQIEEQLTAVFGKLGDDMAAWVVPGLKDLQKVGEGTLETLTRLGTEYRVVDTALRSMSKTFGTTGLESLALRDALVEGAGGLDDFSDKVSFYTENFLTDAERLVPVQAAVTAELSRLADAFGDTKIKTLTTVEGFKDLVQNIDLTGKAGVDLFNAMLNLAPAFFKVAEAAEATKEAVDNSDIVNRRATLEDQLVRLTQGESGLVLRQRAAEMAATIKLDASLGPLLQKVWDLSDAADEAALAQQRVADARSVLSAAYERERSELVATSDKFKSFAKTLRDYRLTLETGQGALLSPEAKYLADKAAFERTAALAQIGNEEALGDLQSVSEAYRTSSEEYYGSSLAYFEDLAGIKAAVSAAENTASRTSSIADQQLYTLRAQVSGLVAINDNLISVREAIINLRSALSGAGGGAGGGTTGGGTWINPLPPSNYFASGGSFVVGGYPGIDQNTMSINGSPVAMVGRGETVTVSPGGAGGEVALLREVVKKLSQVVAELQADKNQRGAAANASIDRLDKVIDSLEGNKRATRQAA